MGEFNPANGLFRYSLETIPTVPLVQGATWHDARFRSFTPSNESENRDDPSIYSGGQRPESLPGKISSNGELEVSVRPEEFTRLFASVQQRVTTSTPAGATNSRLHKMGPSRSSSVLRTFSALFSQDDDNPTRWRGGRLNSLAFSQSREDGFLVGTMGMTFAAGEYWPDATVTTDPDASTKPTLGGIPPLAQWNEATAADSRVHIKITDITDIADGVISAVAKVGGGAYSTEEFLVRIGTNSVTGEAYWVKMYDSTTGALLGQRSGPFTVHFPNSTNLAVDDAWYWDVKRAVWTPSYVSAPPFNEIYAAVYIDGEEFCIDDYTLTLTPPVQEQFCIGGRFAKSIRARGQRTVDLEINREYLDVTLRRRLETAESFILRVDCYSGEEIEAGFEHVISLICPKCIPFGRTPGIESNEEMTESITATCHPDSTNSDYPDDLTVEEVNSLASVTT